MRQSCRYIVYGNPISRRGGDSHIGWNDQRVTRMRWQIELEDQHEGLPLFTGPLELAVAFYFPIPPNSAYKIAPGSKNISKPDIYGFIEFLHAAAKNYVYSENAAIVSLSCKKLYDKRPRTEFTITELL
jgi:Holliday junction resolvase RusA-like endonuclease